jgi:hypothetical protein
MTARYEVDQCVSIGIGKLTDEELRNVAPNTIVSDSEELGVRQQLAKRVRNLARHELGNTDALVLLHLDDAT